MDEVSSHVRLDLPTARSPQRLFHLVFGPHDGTAYVPIPERSTSPRVMLRAAVVDSLKVLDPNRPIREADIGNTSAVTPNRVPDVLKAASTSDSATPRYPI